jgi:hypothetical protein
MEEVGTRDRGVANRGGAMTRSTDLSVRGPHHPGGFCLAPCFYP